MAGINKLLSRQGLDIMKHHDLIEAHDIEKLKSTGVISWNIVFVKKLKIIREIPQEVVICHRVGCMSNLVTNYVL